MIIQKKESEVPDRNNCVIFLDSMAELVEISEKINPNFDNEESHSWTFGHNEEFNNKEKTREYLVDGLTSQKILSETEKIRDRISIIDSIQQSGIMAKRKRTFSESGCELSIDRVLCGDPLHWETRAYQPRRCVKIGINYCMGSANSEEIFMSLCALSIVTCEQLTNRGYSVEIVAIAPVKAHAKNYNKSALVIKLKDASEPLDIARLCSIGIPGMFRYYTFCLFKSYFGNDQGNAISNDMKFFKEELGVEYVITKSHMDSAGDFLSNIINSL